MLFRSLGLMKTLLDAGANPDVRDSYGDTLLTVAADSAPNPKIIKALVDIGMDVEARNNDGMTALMMAARWNSLRIVKTLLEVGANANAKLEASTTAMTTDTADGDIFAAIINNKTTDVPVSAGTTVLMLAALNSRKPDVVKALLDAGLDVNARDEEGRTALMLAARWNTSRIVDTLLDAGADIDIRDTDGRRAADYAQENKNLKSRYVQTRLGAEAGGIRQSDEGSGKDVAPMMQFIKKMLRKEGSDRNATADQIGRASCRERV